MTTKTAILIPARYASTRFPGKPLTKLGNKTMIETVYEKCLATGYDTYVLTDDMRIFELFDARSCWIEPEIEYANGTERCADAITNSFFNEYSKFINVQGDMPDVTEEMIDKCVRHLAHYSVTTMCTAMPEEHQNDPNTVKLVRAADKCLWFGRGMTGYGEWHLGIYGYRRDALELYPNLEVTTEEEVEKLEQLRWLKSGWQIGCSSVYFKGVEINSPEDIDIWHTKHFQ